MAGWRLTSATSVDIAALTELEGRCFTCPWGRLSFCGEFTAPGSGNVVARSVASSTVEEIVGYLFYRFIADETHILRMAVSYEWRRQGIGSHMITECLERAFRKGVTSTLLEVRPSNSQAVELYRKFGFRRIATRPGYYSDSGEDAYILKLSMKKEDL